MGFSTKSFVRDVWITSFSSVVEWAPNMASIFFVGRLGNENYINALGFGIIWTNMLGFAINIGLSTGTEILIA